MLETISWIAIIIGVISSSVIIGDLIRHPQQMTIMNLVWPLNAWFTGPLGIWLYYKWGRVNARNIDIPDNRRTNAKVFVSTSHCAAGCSFGDAIGVPIVAITGFSIAGSILFGHYLLEFILAYAFGIFFQFAAIYPMQKKKNKLKAVGAAIKADTISLVAFEIGMFGWMAIVHYVIFNEPPAPTTPTYWFMMQIAMILGFATSYPANWWLVKKGIKHAM